MVFSSLLFVYAFLPLNLLVYSVAPGLKWKNRVMLCFSLLFYAWAGPAYLLLLIGMTLVDYFCAKTIDGTFKRKVRKRCLFLGITTDLLLLGTFKYLTFLLQNVHNWFGVPETVFQIVLPIGISFYTFQLISYMVDVYRKEVPAQQNFFTLLLYVSLFHQCIAGPIVRYETVAHDLTARHVNRTDVSAGVRRFTIGLAKKALLANTCGSLKDAFLVADGTANAVSILADRPVAALWMGALCYTLQIYLDFSAYSDMAIGMGRMIGFHYLENFRYPYISRSITEFWRRWHISLSSFFRDYVYIPLGGNRSGAKRQVLNLAIVWSLTGFWHGASWNFLIWGVYYFVFLILEKFAFKRLLEVIPSPITWLYTMFVVMMGWVIFWCQDLSYILVIARGLVGLNGNALVDYETGAMVMSHLFFLLFAMFACTPISHIAWDKITSRCLEGKITLHLWKVCQIVVPVVLLLLATCALVGDSYNPFLYFRF